MRKWRPLQKGDTVDIIAPGYAVTEEELEKGCAMLRRHGLIPRVPENLFQPHFLFSNNDEARYKHLYDALYASDSSAIWCVRGGSGTARLLERLPETAPVRCKPVIGLSDITSLHLYLNLKWSWSSIHGAGLARIGENPPETAETFELLFGKKKEICFQNLQPLNNQGCDSLEISAKLYGGNMSILASSLGTPWSIGNREGLLFLEDIGERGYRIDRTLVHLRQAKALHHIKAVVFGDFTGGKEADGSSYIQQALQRFAQESTVPVFQGVETGHGKLQRPLPLHTEIQLIVTEEKAELRCSSGSLS